MQKTLTNTGYNYLLHLLKLNVIQTERIKQHNYDSIQQCNPMMFKNTDQLSNLCANM